MKKNSDDHPFMVKGVTASELQAFDDIWRASRSPRVKSRAEALRLMISAAVTRGAILAPANG